MASTNGAAVPTTEHDGPSVEVVVVSNLTPAQRKAMQAVLNNVYEYRKDDGHDPSAIFHRKVNRRAIPSYYEVIKEPMAMSTIKQKIITKGYKDFSQFVRDFALIAYNAQVYNRPDALAYQDALDIKALLETELKRLVDTHVISAESATLPYLGDIPPPDDLPADPEEEEEEDDDEDEEDEEEGDESDDSRGKRKGRGRPRGSVGIAKRESGGKEEVQRIVETDSRKKRGRPPKVDTPMEARIKNILKGLRRFKTQAGQAKIAHFDRLPDKAMMPEYFNEIKAPMAVDALKKKFKRKKYHSVGQFMRDIELMFENAKTYNEDESEIYMDAVELQKQARKIAEEELKKPDSAFVMEDGRLPLPNGILHNGELYRVGDWVHVQNANDFTKPLVTQIYRTWQDAAGTKWINACWYYRPEQTVHRFDKHFFDNEVVKTGQYRDHQIDEIVDRCFVMFITRYSKGRPRHFPADKEIYVCEARYNEEKHTLNKIKTWASCLPDEVRDKDYEMEMYVEPKKMKKHPSPIAYLLKDDAKETDDLPKPEWGADNAPPKIGAVHKRPRDPRDSPPPEPTPSPPPEPTPPPPRQIPKSTGQVPSSVSNQPNGFPSTAALRHAPTSTPHVNNTLPLPRPFQSATSPAQPARQMPDTRAYSVHTPQTGYTTRVPPPALLPSYHPSAIYPASSNYKTPQPVEVWHLSDSSNSSIPPDIREQFECDEYGRVLFFTVPPIDTKRPVEDGLTLGHSVRYLAAKVRRDDEVMRQKRKQVTVTGFDGEEAKKMKTAHEPDIYWEQVRNVTEKAIHSWEQQMVNGIKADFQALYGQQWKDSMSRHLDRLAQEQAATLVYHSKVKNQELETDMAKAAFY